MAQAFDVPGVSEFTTGIELKTGDTVAISASGIITIGCGLICPGDNEQSPAGKSQSTSSSGFLAPGLPQYSLIGWIGTQGPLPIGAGATITAASPGQLRFAMNDNFYPDNSGTWQVTVQVSNKLACENELRRIYSAGTVLFKTSSAKLDSSSTATLDQLANAAKNCNNARIRVEGHTDSRGTDQDNQLLSERRAQAIVDHLVKAGVNIGALTVQGLGENRPVAPNDTEQGMAKNRRIEFAVD